MKVSSILNEEKYGLKQMYTLTAGFMMVTYCFESDKKRAEFIYEMYEHYFKNYVYEDNPKLEAHVKSLNSEKLLDFIFDDKYYDYFTSDTDYGSYSAMNPTINQFYEFRTDRDDFTLGNVVMVKE